MNETRSQRRGLERVRPSYGSVTCRLPLLLVLTFGHVLAHAENTGAPSPVAVQDDHVESSAVDQEAARLRYFTDTMLVDDQGREVRFYSDVLKDKVVLINFVFTNCPGVCPVHSAKLAELQKLMGDEMGTKLRFVSISVDPERDTPPKLAQYAARFEAGSGWTFLTGTKDNITLVARKLGNTSPEIQAHLPIFLLGNVRTGDWVKMRPDASAKTLAAELRTLLAADATGS